MQVNKNEPSQWMDLGNGAKRRIICEGEELMMVQFEFEKGAVGAPHSHPHTQSTYVAEGVFDFTISDVTKRVSPGDGFLIPSNAIHSCVCIEPGVLVDAFTPRRDDFVEAHGF